MQSNIVTKVKFSRAFLTKSSDRLNYAFELFNVTEPRKCLYKVELNVSIVERVSGK
jgi:hypothetical protein